MPIDLQGKLYRVGDDGPVVKEIQLALAKLGYPLKGSGYFGTATDAAVSAFQRRAGIHDDGIVGQETVRAIDTVLNSPMPALEIVKETTRPLWVTYGLTLIGTKEGSGSRDNSDIIDWAHDEGGDISKEYTHDSIAWCALYQNHLLTKCDLRGTETLWALDFNSDMMKERVGHGWPAVKLSGPMVGAFAPMLRNGGGHIVCVVGRDQHGNVMGLGGNQSDAVSVIPFPQSRLNKGFWYPEGVPFELSTIGFNKLPIVNSSGKVSSRED